MKIIKYFIILFLFLTNHVLSANDQSFKEWLKNFKIYALKNNISESTFDMTMSDVVFLPKVIKYDRFQPEFYEDTKTYITKRTSKNKIKKGIAMYKRHKILINKVEKDFSVNKELLLALMGIETNFGTYLGKMDIISSLATLSYDKRRSEFFENELITLLKLIDNKIVDHKSLYGSWAGAFGNFQFMPSTINNYAIDYDLNNVIELKSFSDSIASAANYVNKMGWKQNEPCFIKINLTGDIDDIYLNTSAKKIKNKKKITYFKKYIKNFNQFDLDNDLLAAIITPDKDIVPDADKLQPAYLVFNNYELILKWNRSLRFALAVCTLKGKLSNDL